MLLHLQNSPGLGSLIATFSGGLEFISKNNGSPSVLKRAVLYARVSTSSQDVSSQLYALRAFAEQRGYKITEEYCDVGSGAKRDRPVLAELMKAAERRMFDYVLVFRFDRYARSTVHLIESLMAFRKLGIGFISYSENIDTESPLGEALFTIISALASLERSIIRERVINGIANARAKGKVLGRPTTVDRLKVRELRAKGYSLKKIAEELGITKSAVSKILKKLTV